jgi:hypothetical protein
MIRKALLAWCSALFIALPVLSVSATAAPQARLAYWVTADLVRGSNDAAGPIGAQTNVFKQGEEVVFRARILDVATGQDPGREGKGVKVFQELGLKAVAYLEDGQSFPMTYGQHPPQAQGREAVAWFWTASWKIPAAYNAPNDAAQLAIPLRSARYVKWWIIVTDKKGASVRFDPVGAGTALPNNAIVIEKR